MAKDIQATLLRPLAQDVIGSVARSRTSQSLVNELYLHATSVAYSQYSILLIYPILAQSLTGMTV